MKGAAAAYWAGALAAKQRYLARLPDAQAIQASVRAQIVSENRRSLFGQEHGFERIASADDFSAQVPLRDYASLSPWIERAASGESAVLTEAPPAVFHLTSGTTGVAKTIPLTRPGAAVRLRNAPALRASLLESHPEVLASPDATLALTINPPSRGSFTSGGIPVCWLSETDWASLGFPRQPGGPGYGASWSRLPHHVDDPHYARIRLAIECPLRAVLSWYPASILHFADTLKLNAATLVRELHDGTLCGVPSLQPNRQRGREIEKLFSRSAAPSLRDVWPHLSVVECWTGSSSDFFVPQLTRCLGEQVKIFPAGYGSTESPIAMPIGRDHAALLDVTCAYFEFIPTDAADDTTTLQFFELERDHEYAIVFTTMSGLYRYLLGDVVRVTDFIRGVPTIEFSYRRGIAGSLIGEKLSEAEVLRALRRVIAELAPGGGSEAALCPVHNESLHYVAAVEGSSQTEETVQKLSRTLDTHFAENEIYRAFRARGLISGARVVILAPGTFAAHRRLELEQRRVAPAQQKHKLIIQAAQLADLFRLSDRMAGTSE